MLVINQYGIAALQPAIERTAAGLPLPAAPLDLLGRDLNVSGLRPAGDQAVRIRKITEM